MATEFTGERVIPDQVDADLLNEHLARYAFAARLARGKRVLDAGCGAGYGAAELANTALSVVGLDVVADAVAYAHAHYTLPNLRFEQGSCTSLPYPDESFDLVVAFEVVEHLADWHAFLLEVRRVLAPPGQFIVSTPNKLYYAESRRSAGPNPFHAHEFEFDEFRAELSAVFPHISLFLENHVEGVAFRPVERGETAEVRVDGAEARPAESHFFVAVCARRPQTGNPAFVYIPTAANVLRERETHIGLLEGFLEQAKSDLAALNTAHQKLTAELEESNRWADGLNADVAAKGTRIADLQAELTQEQAKATAAIANLEEENRQKTEWAQHSAAELEAKLNELAQCVENLHAAERTVDERTRWAHELQTRLSLFEASRWVLLGRRFGLGPPPQ